jgi:hypothetical protein
VATIHYLLTKWQDRARSSQALADLTRIVRVAPLDHEAVLQALALGWPDFEDALQAVCAQNAGADHFVTRDPDDFSSRSMFSSSSTRIAGLDGMKSHLQEGLSLFAAYGGKSFQKAVQRLTRPEVMDENLDGNSGAGKDQCAAHDVGTARNDLLSLHGRTSVRCTRQLRGTLATSKFAL